MSLNNKRMINTKNNRPQANLLLNTTELNVLEDAVITLSKGMKKLLSETMLTERAILLLLQDLTKMSRAQIKTVLDALPKLESTYIKKGEKK